MPHLSPTTLAQVEQKAILLATAKHPRDHLVISMALGTGVRLGEIVGLNVGDVFSLNGIRLTEAYAEPAGTPREA
jgi:integrase